MTSSFRNSVRAVAVIVALAAAVVVAAPASAANWNFETLDGQSTAGGRTTNDVGTHNATVVWNNQPHVWNFDDTAGDLRHAWWTGTSWAFETLDGDRNTDGHTTNAVGLYAEAKVWNNEPHIWYYDITARDLRHAWWNGIRWVYETLDGNSSADGRTTNDVGIDVAVAVWNNEPHIWYRDDTAKDLRHAWWNGARWAYETLDGNANTGGRTTNFVGRFSAPKVWNNEPHVWYHDDSAQDLRHAWWNGARWVYETLDGIGGTGGRTTNFVGLYNSVSIWNGFPHVWYYDDSNYDLRHAWWTGSNWAFEVLDGNSTADGRVDRSVGSSSASAVWNGEPHVWYRDGTLGDLRHAWWNGSRWVFEALDGNGTANGRTNNDVGVYTAVTVWNKQPHVFYYDGTIGDLRHAFYG